VDFQQAFQNINWLAVLAAACSTFFIGGLWYSPLVFGKKWMAINGFSEEDVHQGSAAKILGGTLVLSFFSATTLSLFVGPQSSVGFCTVAGFLIGLDWIAVAFGITYLFERKSFTHFLINAGYFIVAFTLMGFIIGIWK
jgi:hypothetical protein